MTLGPNVRYAWNRLVQAGMSEYGAAGFCGNFLAESGVKQNPWDIDPGVHQNGGGPGRGIAQWTLGARWATLQRYCAAHRLDPLSMVGQMSFVIFEAHDMGVWAAASAQASPEGAAAYVMRRYEMPAGSDPTARERNARTVYMAFHGSGGISRYALHRVLQVGCSGDDVKHLQAAVGVAADGVFGTLTKSGVFTFQRTHGLAPDGVVGAQTCAALGWVWGG